MSLKALRTLWFLILMVKAPKNSPVGQSPLNRRQEAQRLSPHSPKGKSRDATPVSPMAAEAATHGDWSHPKCDLTIKKKIYIYILKYMKIT